MSNSESAFRNYADYLVRHWLEAANFTHVVSGPRTHMALRDREVDRFRGRYGLEIIPIKGNEDRVVETLLPWLRRNYPQGPPEVA